MLAVKEIHAFINEDHVYNKLSSIGMSFGYKVNKLNKIKQLFSMFDQHHPQLIVIDSSVNNNQLEDFLKYLLYSHCPYTILFLGEHPLLQKPHYGMREVISELNILGYVKKPIRVDDIMDTFNKIEQEPNLLTGKMVQKAIANNEFELYYQPSVGCFDHQIISAEALIRWNHPDLGMIGPDRFIPIAEESNVIQELSKWTFEVCIKQISAWQKVGLNLELAINLSEKILNNDATYSCLESLCQTHHIDTSDISLEITESVYKKQSFNQYKSLEKLKNLGFKLVIDDFELKYFNLPEMNELLVDGLKLNRCHIIDLDTNENSRKITKSLIEIAHNYDIEIGATGVESLNVWQLLTDYGCDHAQGYYICKPVAVADFNKWVGIKSN